MKKLISLFLLCFISFNVQAKNPAIVRWAENYHFDQQEVVGIEAELTGLSTKRVAEILIKTLHGELRLKQTKEEGFNHKGELTRFMVQKYKIKKSLIGDVEVKPEDNTFDEASYMDSQGFTQTVEIVSSPMDESQSLRLGRALKQVQRQGGLGTSEHNAVSLQINVQVVGERHPYKTPKYLIKLLRDYYDSENYQILMKHFEVPPIRQAYIGRPSAGLLQRIENPRYTPTTRKFYDDVMYRQTLEFISGDENLAWSLPLAKVHERVLEELKTKGLTDAMMRSFKWNDIKLTALLIYWFPNDPLSQMLVKTTWFRGYPAIEFRAPNNDFNLKETAAEILSLVKAARSEKPLRLGTFLPCESHLL